MYWYSATYNTPHLTVYNCHEMYLYSVTYNRPNLTVYSFRRQVNSSLRMSASNNTLSRTAAGTNLRAWPSVQVVSVRATYFSENIVQCTISCTSKTARRNIRFAVLLVTDRYYSPALNSQKFTHFHKKNWPKVTFLKYNRQFPIATNISSYHKISLHTHLRWTHLFLGILSKVDYSLRR